MNQECFEVLRNHNYGDVMVETEYWFILLAPDQKNIGTCVIALKRHEGDLGNLNDKEWNEFSKIVKSLQSALKKTFNATMFNWGCLMNSSYLKEHPDPHVHWHFIPRYKNKVEFEAVQNQGFVAPKSKISRRLTFKDPCFGFSTMKSKEGVREIPENVRMKIIKEIKRNLEI
ncbi:HIT family protein [Methanobacterium sp. ACI-7]|uniref:HIT family protein n=1 Tax=unclassified Methanobacterium TaxID=2627676 RepID=UPI0039C20C36